MKEALAAKLIDQDTGLFRWWKREDRLDLYQTGLGWPLAPMHLRETLAASAKRGVVPGDRGRCSK